MRSFSARDMLEKSCFSADEWSVVGDLTKVEDENSRIEAVEILVCHPEAGSENVLLKMLGDRAALVRASVCEGLSFSKSKDTLKALVKATTDRSRLVRGYAVLSIADIQRNIGGSPRSTLSLLHSLYGKEHSLWVKSAYGYAFLTLGEKEGLSLLTAGLTARRYDERCFAANLLADAAPTLTQAECTHLIDLIGERQRTEPYVSVKSSLARLAVSLSEKSDFLCPSKKERGL